jgi:hypothetical protein
MKSKHFILIGICCVIVYVITACTNPPTSPLPPATTGPTAVPVGQSTPGTAQPTTPALATRTALPSETVILTALLPTEISLSPAPPTRPRPTLGPDEWKRLPVIPTISDHVIRIYQLGLQLGNNPNAFSKIGDCGSTPAWFLGDFDRNPQLYNLGDYQGLLNVIHQYQGSFGRTSLAARSGFNASSLFVTLWSDRTFCQANEAPLECEYRVHQPSIAFIMLGTNDVWHPEEFEPQMRNIIEFSLQKGVVPILSTKADNIEGDGSLNATIAKLAQEYDIPLWNFWAAVQKLPNQGLQEDQAHLTWGRNFFNDPEALTKAWPIRNLNALEMLNAVWQKVAGTGTNQ